MDAKPGPFQIPLPGYSPAPLMPPDMSLFPPSRGAWRRALAALALPLALLLAAGCGEYKMTTAHPGPRQTTGDPEVFATAKARQKGTRIAVVSSRPRAGMDDATMAEHLREIRGAARRAGADAVVNARLLTVKKHGYVADPNTPFPSATQGDYARYIMRGDAIVYDPPKEEMAEESNGGMSGDSMDGGDLMEGEEPMGADDAAPMAEESAEAGTDGGSVAAG